MSLLRHLFLPLREIEAELATRFAEEIRPEIDAVVHAVDAVLEHPARLEELRERATLLKHAAGALPRHHAEARVRWLEIRTHHQVHKALGLATYGALVGAVALMALPGAMGDVARLGFAAAAWLAGLCVVVSLSVQWLGWPTHPGTFAHAPKEADWLLGVMVRRAWQVNVAVAAAFVATLVLGAGAWAWSAGV